MTNNNKEEQITTKQNMATSSFDLASPIEDISKDLLPAGKAIALSQVDVAAPTPILTRDMIERAVITFFDNGEGSKQRYKLAIRLNLKDEPLKDSPEFISPLSKDPRTFRRYAAPGTRDDLIEFHNEIRVHVKEKGVENKPYFGKFHLNHSNWTNQKAKIQVEPNCYASIWYDGDCWSGIVKLYDFLLKFDTYSDNITLKQSKMGVKSTYLWINHKHDKQQRPLTWAQRRALGK
jgi:hypothetical protein